MGVWVHGVAGGEGGNFLGVLGEESVVKRVFDDDAFRRTAHLPCVPMASKDGPVDGFVEFGVAEDDEGVGAAEFEGGFLKVLGGGCRNCGSCPFGAGKSDAAHAWVGKDCLGSVVICEDVD
ncbi:hypothetical protein FRC0077_02264 [Corynebacterium diphtheriae]|nr:hypothetical protein FRC0076_02254 [Corynebacterium diphtheriae]CAB0716084.1 hypothetical protein FRC0077_02264 [Corynebacterium diphtheriae]